MFDISESVPKIVHNIELYKNTLSLVLQQFAKVPKDELKEFLDLFYVETYEKNKNIIEPNNTNFKGYFIIKGIVRMHYRIGKKEITSDFREANSFFINGMAMFTGSPNFDYFTAKENTTCLVVDWNQLEAILKKYHSLEHLGRRILEWHYAQSIRASYNSNFLSVEERYELFVKERSSLLGRIKLKHIASYLGITPETLSRLRAKYQVIGNERREK